jgi:hypothetical protein
MYPQGVPVVDQSLPKFLTRSMNISLDTRTIGQRFGQKSDADSRGPDADVIS